MSEGNSTTISSKTDWFDSLRAIATVGVVGIHVSSYYVPGSGQIPDYDFWIGNIFDSLSRFAVPMFVMLSGALLLGKEDSPGIFLKKRFSRMLIPFLFWSFIYIGQSIWNDYDNGLHPTAFQLLRTIFVQLRDGSSLHLWYIYMLIGLYLFVPIIGKWARRATEKEFLYFLGIWLLFIFLDQPFLEKMKPDIDIRYFTGYAGYLVLGYYLKIKNFGSRNQSKLIGCGMIATGLAITIGGTWAVHAYTHQYVSTFYEPLSPGILLYSAGLFIAFKEAEIQFRPLIKTRNFISKYSYGIYLVHVLYLFKLDEWGIGWHFINPIAGIPATILCCLALSSLTIYTLHRIPGGKYIAG